MPWLHHKFILLIFFEWYLSARRYSFVTPCFLSIFFSSLLNKLSTCSHKHRKNNIFLVYMYKMKLKKKRVNILRLKEYHFLFYYYYYYYSSQFNSLCFSFRCCYCFVEFHILFYFHFFIRKKERKKK